MTYTRAREVLYFTVAIFLCYTSSVAQPSDSIQHDLDHLTDAEFFTKYSIVDAPVSALDGEVTRRVWTTAHIKSVARENNLSRGRVLTMIVERPTKTNSYFVLGVYRVARPDHFVSVGRYRLDITMNVLQFQNVTGDGWADVN